MASGDASARFPVSSTVSLKKRKKEKQLILSPDSARRFRVPDLQEAELLEELGVRTQITYGASKEAVTVVRDYKKPRGKGATPTATPTIAKFPVAGALSVDGHVEGDKPDETERYDVK